MQQMVKTAQLAVLATVIAKIWRLERQLSIKQMASLINIMKKKQAMAVHISSKIVTAKKTVTKKFPVRKKTDSIIRLLTQRICLCTTAH